MGNHVHMLVEATGAEALGRAMKAFGIRLAKAVNRAYGRRGPILADRYHFRALETPLEVRRALRYVLRNAARHAKRDATARIDPASSGRWFDGWRGGTPLYRTVQRPLRVGILGSSLPGGDGTA